MNNMEDPRLTVMKQPIKCLSTDWTTRLRFSAGAECLPSPILCPETLRLGHLVSSVYQGSVRGERGTKGCTTRGALPPRPVFSFMGQYLITETPLDLGSHGHVFPSLSSVDAHSCLPADRSSFSVVQPMGRENSIVNLHVTKAHDVDKLSKSVLAVTLSQRRIRRQFIKNRRESRFLHQGCQPFKQKLSDQPNEIMVSCRS